MGPGRDALLLREEGLTVSCLDASEKMVERTKNLGFETIHADFRDMSFADNIFDGVWAYTSLLHITKEDVISVVKKIHGLLKDKGIFLVGMIEGSYEGNKESETMPKTPRYFRYYEANELKELIVPLGFDFICEDRYRPHERVYLSQTFRKR